MEQPAKTTDKNESAIFFIKYGLRKCPKNNSLHFRRLTEQ
jgi:hypothetical protein